MSLRTAILSLLVMMVVASLGASWTAVWLLHHEAQARQSQAERAEARTELVRQDVGALLEEIRDPAGDTRRSELWRRAERIERMAEEIYEHFEIGDAP